MQRRGPQIIPHVYDAFYICLLLLLLLLLFANRFAVYGNDAAAAGWLPIWRVSDARKR